MTIRQKLTTGHLSTLFHLGKIGDLSDRQLLERFATGQGEPADLAFSAILERHGPMVLRACNALLRDPHDAQDAFQATFLVLLRKSRELWVHDSLGPWLHRVARRTAARAQAIARRRRECERNAALSRTAPDDRAGHDTPSSVLHDEIDRLPEPLRVLVVLCHLEGQTQELAAKTLSLPLGTVKSRLHRARDQLRFRLSQRGVGCSAGLLTPDTPSRPADSIHSLPLYSSMLRAAAQAGLSRAARDTFVSARAVQIFEETMKTIFLTRIRIGAALVLLAGCIAWGASSVLAQQDPRRPGAEPATGRTPVGEATGNTPAGHRGAPAYVRRSRTMIVERLEQELKRTEGQLAQVTARTRSPENDAVSLHLRKTVAKLAGLLDRIDPVLTDAVNEFPTIFDFTTAHAILSAMAGQVETVTAFPASPNTKPAAPAAAPSYNAHSLAEAAEKMEWARRMSEKGYVSKAERDRYVKEYEALKASIDSDVARAADRVDWARRMFEKGYVTKRQYDSEILKHYDALKARAQEEPHAVTDELLERYELLKAKVEKSARMEPSDSNQPAPNTQPAKAAKKSGTDVRGQAKRDRDKLPPQADDAPATDDNANRDRAQKLHRHQVDAARHRRRLKPRSRHSSRHRSSDAAPAAKPAQPATNSPRPF